MTVIKRIAVSCILLLAACEREPFFHVERFVQEDSVQVRLNEPLVLRFSREIDRSSITGSTVSVIDADGQEVPGAWTVQGRTLRFHPRLPLKPDCSDAGLLPGREYKVLIKGFPELQAVRALGGRHLAKHGTYIFKTLSAEEMAVGLFVDPVTGSGPCLIRVNGELLDPMNFSGIDILEGEEVRLTFSEPIFPGSVAASEARVHLIDPQGQVKLDDPLPLVARTMERDLSGSTIVLQPLGGFEAGRHYKLYRDYLDFTDFGGNTIEAKGFNYIQINCVKEPEP